MNGIKGNGYKKVEIDMGGINCADEPNIIDLNGHQFIIRYKAGDNVTTFGNITLEALAD